MKHYQGFAFFIDASNTPSTAKLCAVVLFKVARSYVVLGIFRRGPVDSLASVPNPIIASF